MNIIGPISSGPAAGGAGVATANADTSKVISGEIVGLYLKYLMTPPAGTTDIVIKTKGTLPAAPSYNLLAITDAATDGLFFVRGTGVDAANAAITNSHVPIPVHDYINVLIAQANDDDYIEVWLFLR